MAVGGFLMSLHQSNDPSGVMIVLGILLFVPGLVIALAVGGGWLVAKVIGSFGDQTGRYLRRAIGLLVIGWIVWSLISVGIRVIGGSTTDFEEDIVAMQEAAATEEYTYAKVRSGPGTQFNILNGLTRGEIVQILAVTDVRLDGFSWYRIRTESGVNGYVAGGNLCAKEHWIDGIHHNCEVL